MNKKDEKHSKEIIDAGNVMRVQRHQLSHAEEQSVQNKDVLDELHEMNSQQDSQLDQLEAAMAELEQGLYDDIPEEEWTDISEYDAKQIDAHIEMTEVIPLEDEDSWEEYLSSTERYAELYKMDLNSDPFVSLMSKKDQEEFARQVHEDFYERKPDCDQWDYAIAAFSGVVAGLVDVFLVGTPQGGMKHSPLGKWTDDMTNQAVIRIAKAHGRGCGWKPEPGNENSLVNAFQFLEKVKVNYDQAKTDDLGEAAKAILGNMRPSNHHIKNLAHSPDLVGLLFSVINQFSSTASFVNYKGKLCTFNVKSQELEGGNFIAKIYCGIVNWFWHCVSDFAGSKKSALKGNRGTGLPIPGMELFQFLPFGKFDEAEYSHVIHGKRIKEKYFLNFSELTVKVFENGYDARFGMALSIPVVISELLVRFCFAIKRYYFHHLPLNECIPLNSKIGTHPHQPELRRMLLVAHGCLCLCDGVDAGVRGVMKQEWLTVALRLNYVAWGRLAMDGLAELRAHHRQNHIDVSAIQKKTKEEWDNLYSQADRWNPAGFSSVSST